MYTLAYLMLVLALLGALGAGALALLALWNGRPDAPRLVENAHWCISGALGAASALLLHALYWHDFSLQYVANYTDLILPAFYRLTAFWAGQPGSMLFWALAVSASGSLFALTPAYKRLSLPTKLWHWAFFYSIMGFFALLLTSFSNPFIMQHPAPHDGNGLNPLLQNPGMIFHPPLLFLGYGGFTVPACLALAQSVSQRQAEEGDWFRLARPFLLPSWIFLTAGIILGAWWAYMELGWGGYWAWDPVENASLVPWLLGTASLHTLAVQRRRGKLARINTIMISLTTVSAFFATFLVRSGIVESVHAFGESSVGLPLILFVLTALVITCHAASLAPAAGKPLEGPGSREGLLTLASWILLALAAIILLATIWPVVSGLWSSTPRGLDAGFYNRVCLPLGAILLVFLVVCPWLGWNGGLRERRKGYAVFGVGLAAGLVAWVLGYRQPVALAGMAAAVGVGLGSLLLLGEAATRRQIGRAGPLGAHLGLALVALGIAFSGPYSTERDFVLAEGQSDQLEGYTLTLEGVSMQRRPGHEALVAKLRAVKDGENLGTLVPERRIYEKFGDMQFSEVDTIASLGNELYASLLGLDEDSRVVVRFSIKPLVNWFWIGGVILCLAPLLGLARGEPRPSDGNRND